MTRRSHVRAGFTMVEILIAMIILGILAAIAFSAIDPTTASDATATRAELTRLVAALQEARSETGFYPETSGLTTSAVGGLPFTPSGGFQYRVYGAADRLSVYAEVGPTRAPAKTCTMALGGYDTGAGVTCTAF